MDGLTGTKAGSGVWQRIISEMPEHDVYMEPFWGRGTIARRKRPAQYTIGCDLDPVAVSHDIAGGLVFLADGIQFIADYFRLPLPEISAARTRNAERGGPRGPLERASHDREAAAGVAGNGDGRRRLHHRPRDSATQPGGREAAHAAESGDAAGPRDSAASPGRGTSCTSIRRTWVARATTATS